MQTLLEVLQKSEQYLASKGVARAKFEAESLISESLAMSRLEMYLHYQRPLEEKQLVVLRERMKRRAAREPLQYILGTTPFMGLNLLTDPRALIPRQETEELADLLIRRFEGSPPASVLDLGTGTGALALALAKAFPEARVEGVDRSPQALELARENAQRNHLERVHFLEGSWFEPVAGKYDLIVSNPPYLSEEEWGTAEPEVRQHEPRTALVAPDDGVADLLHLLKSALEHLNHGALLALETGIAHHEQLKQEARKLGYQEIQTVEDLSKRPRFFLASPC